MLKEAIKRMREGNIQIIPGYDGEFGKIRIFKENEIQL
jgi:PHP family Zn ribbon phosphoesterase